MIACDWLHVVLCMLICACWSDNLILSFFLFRLDQYGNDIGQGYAGQFQQQSVAVPQQQEELQTVTHKKVVVRTIQTRDGQVMKEFAFWAACAWFHSLSLVWVDDRLKLISC